MPPLVSAAVMLLWAAALPMYSFWHYLLALGVSAGLGILSGKLFTPHELPEQTQRGQETREEAPKTDRDVIAEGRERIKDLRRLNSLIDDEKISRQIEQMENIAGRIFDYVEVHPEKLRSISRFLNYYLPTSIKLLRTYDDLSCQGVDGTNINGTMRSIEDVMDTIVLAYQRQLDSLFADKALDISTDITVLENFMTAEGIDVGGKKEKRGNY